MLRETAVTIGVTVLYFALVVVGLLVGAVWIDVLISIAGFVNGPLTELPHAAVAFAMSLAVACTAIWVASQVGVLDLGVETERGIWRTLIASILGAFALAVAKTLKGS